MPGIAYDQVMTTGHGKYKPTQVNSSQTKVFVQGTPALVQGDLANNHGHTPVGQCIGNSKVFITGKIAIKQGDSLTDGDHIAQGSSKVFIN